LLQYRIVCVVQRVSKRSDSSQLCRRR